MKSHSRKWVCDRTWWRWRHWGRTCKVKPGTAGGNRRKGSPVRWCRHPRKWAMGVSLRRRQRPSKGCNTSSLYSKSVTSFSLHFFSAARRPLFIFHSAHVDNSWRQPLFWFPFFQSKTLEGHVATFQILMVLSGGNILFQRLRAGRCESPATHFKVWKFKFSLSNSYAF